MSFHYFYGRIAHSVKGILLHLKICITFLCKLRLLDLRSIGLLVPALLIQSQFLTAQEALDTTSQHLTKEHGYVFNGYNKSASVHKSFVVSKIDVADFNQGIISDPFLLIQGRIPGVQIYHRGLAPNRSSIFRSRGLSGIAQSQEPLIILDGIAQLSIENIDPLDIANMVVLRDVASQSIYGSRAANGVVLINSHSGSFERDTSYIQYHGQVGTSSVINDNSLLDADQFRDAGGFDLGHSTDWVDQITRAGRAQVHGLSYFTRRGNTSLNLSGHYRQIRGVLEDTGFDRLNLRSSINGSLNRDRLQYHAHLSIANIDRQVGFQEALRYAHTFNPTAPLSGADVPFSFNEDQYGGYYENLGLYDSHNPLAIIDLNERYGKARIFSSSIHLDYSLGSRTNIHLRYALQRQFSNHRTFYSPFSLYRGNAFSNDPDEKGVGILRDTDDNFSSYEIFITGEKEINDIQFSYTLGSAYHNGTYLEEAIQFKGLTDASRVEVSRLEDLSPRPDSASTVLAFENGWNDRLLSFFGSASVNFQDEFYFDATLRSDNSSKLGDRANRGIFYGAGIAWNIKSMKDLPSLEQLLLRASYGSTGGLPFQGGLSESTKVYSTTLFGNTFFPGELDKNPDLKWEEKKELSIGFALASKKLDLTLNWYTNSFVDWIGYDFNFNLGRAQNLNQNRLISSGIELGIDYTLINSSNTQLSSGINLSFFRSKFSEVAESRSLATDPGGITDNPLVSILQDEELGMIYGAEFSGSVDEEGNGLYNDVNQDGVVIIAQSLFGTDGDFVTLGSGIPDIELGWHTQFKHRGWELSTLIRGAFGHVLVNRKRQLQEPGFLFDNPLFSNLIQTDLAVDGLKVSRFSSLHVEKADFLKLDFISISRSFSLSASEYPNQMTISLTAQNLFTLSSYTGIDPEPSLRDDWINPFSFFDDIEYRPGNLLAPGIDRRTSYLPSRSFVLSVKLNI